MEIGLREFAIDVQSPRAYCLSRGLPLERKDEGDPDGAVRAFGADEPGRLRLLQSAVRVAQHDPDQVRVGGGHVLCQPNQLGAALDPDPLLFDRRAQDAFGLGLRNEQEVVIAAFNPREVEAKDALASAIKTGGKAAVAKPDRLVRQAAQLEQLQRARLHPDGTGRLWIGWVESACGEDWKCQVGSADRPVQLPAGRHYWGREIPSFLIFCCKVERLIPERAAELELFIRL